MMRKLLGALYLCVSVFGGVLPAAAQSTNVLVVETCGTATLQAGLNRLGVLTVDQSGNLCMSAGGGGGISVTQGTNPWLMSFNVPSIARTIAGCVVGTSSAACLGSNPRGWVQLQNTSSSATIACSWGGPASLNGTTSFMLAPGQAASWGPTTGSAPSEALNCIATAASSPLYVEQN